MVRPPTPARKAGLHLSMTCRDLRGIREFGFLVISEYPTYAAITPEVHRRSISRYRAAKLGSLGAQENCKGHHPAGP